MTEIVRFLARRRCAAPTLVAALLLPLLLGMAACSAGHRPVTLAVIARTGGTGYWNAFGTSARARAGRYGYLLQISDPQSPANYEEQARLLNQAIQRHVSGIILAPSHQLVLAEGVRRAHAAGIPVVIVDAPIAVQPSDYVTSIGCGDDAIGFMAAQRFLETGKGPQRVLVVGASPTLQMTTQREDALRRVLQRFAPQHHIVASRYTLSDWARARQVTLEALAADPGINAIFSSDEFSTHGVLSALSMLKTPRSLTLVGISNDPEAREAVRTGKMSMAIACDAPTVAELAVDAMHEALEKRPVAKLTQTEAVRVTGENLETPEVRRVMPW